MKLIWKIGIPASLVIATAIAAGVISYKVFYVGDFAVVESGVLYRCRQPSRLQWNVLTSYNIRTVVNLRMVEEDPNAFEQEKSACAKAGVKLVHIPVVAMPTDEQVDEFLRTVRDHPPVLVHDHTGKSRTGVMAAAYRVVFDNWSVEEAMIELGNLGGASGGNKGNKTTELLTRVKADRAKWLAPASQPASGPASQPATRS